MYCWKRLILNTIEMESNFLLKGCCLGLAIAINRDWFVIIITQDPASPAVAAHDACVLSFLSAAANTESAAEENRNLRIGNLCQDKDKKFENL